MYTSHNQHFKNTLQKRGSENAYVALKIKNRINQNKHRKQLSLEFGIFISKRIVSIVNSVFNIKHNIIE